MVSSAPLWALGYVRHQRLPQYKCRRTFSTLSFVARLCYLKHAQGASSSEFTAVATSCCVPFLVLARILRMPCFPAEFCTVVGARYYFQPTAQVSCWNNGCPSAGECTCERMTCSWVRWWSPLICTRVVTPDSALQLLCMSQ